MDRKIIVTGSLFFLTSIVQAFEVIPPGKFIRDEVKISADSSCINFSGHWQGICVADQVPNFPLDVTLNQLQCDSVSRIDNINKEGSFIVMGGFVSKQIGGFLNTASTSTLTSNWTDESMQRIDTDGHSTVVIGDGGMLPMKSESTMYLQDGALQIETTLTWLPNPEGQKIKCSAQRID